MTDVIDNLIDEIERSYEELTEQLSDPELLADRGATPRRRAATPSSAEAHALALQYREAERAGRRRRGDARRRRRPTRRPTTRCATTCSRSSTRAAAGSTSSPKRSACRCSRATPTTTRT